MSGLGVGECRMHMGGDVCLYTQTAEVHCAYVSKLQVFNCVEFVGFIENSINI